jgi:hypothetical protein
MVITIFFLIIACLIIIFVKSLSLLRAMLYVLLDDYQRGKVLELCFLLYRY